MVPQFHVLEIHALEEIRQPPALLDLNRASAAAGTGSCAASVVHGRRRSKRRRINRLPLSPLSSLLYRMGCVNKYIKSVSVKIGELKRDLFLIFLNQIFLVWERKRRKEADFDG